MQAKSINGKTSVGLKASKTSKIVSLFHLILKILALQLLRNSYENASDLLKQKYKLHKMIRKHYIIRENCYYLTNNTRG